MWVRKRLDLNWSDLAFGMRRCFFPPDDRLSLQGRVEGLWSPGSDALACLSARTGFDLLLESLHLPSGSEVLVSAITIPDMVRIIDRHGLIAVPVDMDMRSLSPRPESLRKALSPATRAILWAHLFGSRVPLESLFEETKPRRIFFIEDCAQAFSGLAYRGHPEADVSLFSFGPIKTATALGGALLLVRDLELLSRMRERQSQYPVQPASVYFRRLLKYAWLMALSARPSYGLFVRFCRALGSDHDRWINRSTRAFSGPDFFECIRQQPSSPILALLERRLRQFDTRVLARRKETGDTLARLLDGAVTCPGASLSSHHFWLFPVVVENPAKVMLVLQRQGFDATQGESLCVVGPPQGRPELEPAAARDGLSKLLFLPCYPEMPGAAVERMAKLVREQI